MRPTEAFLNFVQNHAGSRRLGPWTTYFEHQKEGRTPQEFVNNAMFRVSQEIEFCYGHRLLNYDGKCKYLHGHNGKAVIVLEADALDHRGMLVDFSDIKKHVAGWIDANLDHRMILNEDDPVVPMLKTQGEPLFLIPANPTAENIAKLIYDFAKSHKLPVKKVSLWETFKSHASYAE